MSPSSVSDNGRPAAPRSHRGGQRLPAALGPFVEAKLVIPRRLSGTLRRTRLLRQLRSAQDRPVISVVAPPGFGKTSLLAQWATENPGPVAWLTADNNDNDPVVFVSDLAAAIDRVEPLGPYVTSAIASATVSQRTVVGWLLQAMSQTPDHVRIAIDDAHRITARACLDVLAELITHLPAGSPGLRRRACQIRLPFTRWRATGSVLEIGPAELAMDEHEAAGLGHELGLRLPTETAAELMRQTQGWPALLALATLGARTSARDSRSIERGSDQLVADYLRSEVLEGRSKAQIAFMTRTSILERLIGIAVRRRGGRERSTEIRAAPGRLDPPGRRVLAEPTGITRCCGTSSTRARRPRARRVSRRSIGAPRRGTSENGAIESAVDHAFAAGRSSTSPQLSSATTGTSITGPAVARRSRRGPRRFRRCSSRHAHGSPCWRHGRSSPLAMSPRRCASRMSPNEDVRGQAARRHRLLRGRAGDAPSSHGPRGAADALANATRAVELEGGRRRLARLRALAAGRRASHARATGQGADAAFADAHRRCPGGRPRCDPLLPARASRPRGHRAGRLGRRRCPDRRERGDRARAATVDDYLSAIPSRAVRIRLAIERGDSRGARYDLARATSLRPFLTAALPAAVRSSCLLAFARAHLAVDDPAGARALSCRRAP